MIRELQISTFMKEKVSFLTALARDIASRLHLIDTEIQADDGDVLLDERDVAELLASLETMNNDPSLWEPTSDRWLPRSAYAGLLQASVEEYYRANQAVEDAPDAFGERLIPNRDLLVSASLRQSTTPDKRTGRFTLSKLDPRWVVVLFAKHIKRRHGSANFPDNRKSVAALSESARILVVGDWGSGIPGAIQVAQTMRRQYILPEIRSREIHVVHLGDVYYAGLAREYRKNFLRHWPVDVGEESDVRSWCLPGNHDMYTGGHTFFAMLQDVRFTRQNKSSYFLLENGYWQLFALDSAYEPIDFTGDTGVLYSEQAAWFAQRRALAPQKKCILLTHHQPFSTYGPPEPAFERRFRPLAESGHIDAWIWGHEHACVLYGSCGGIRYPLLLGHGGFPQRPMSRTSKAGLPIQFEWTKQSPSGDLAFGFAVFDFDRDSINVQLVAQDGPVEHSFRIS